MAELFSNDNVEIKSNNEDENKYLEKREFVSNTAPKLYDKLLYTNTIQYENFSEDHKKNVNVENFRPENLIFDFVEDNSPLDSDKEVKLEPERLLLKE